MNATTAHPIGHRHVARIGHFALHFGEMCVPMCIGFAVGDLVYFGAAGLGRGRRRGGELGYVSLGRPSYEQLAALVVEQAATIERLEAEVGELRAEVVELKRRLAANSRNSSRPPSSDGVAKPAPRSLRRVSGRKPGGQPAHGGGHLMAVAVPDEVVRHPPGSCAGCGGDLTGAAVQGCERRQVFDPPAIGLRVVEHVVEWRRCACGRQTAGAFPAGLSAPTQYAETTRAPVSSKCAAGAAMIWRWTSSTKGCRSEPPRVTNAASVPVEIPAPSQSANSSAVRW